MKKRWLKMLTGSAFLTAVVTGAMTAGAATTVSVAIWDNNQLSGLQQIADEWGAEHDVNVDFRVMDWSTYWTMLEAGASGGDMPDVFWMHSANAQKYMDANLLLPLDEYIAELCLH